MIKGFVLKNEKGFLTENLWWSKVEKDAHVFTDREMVEIVLPEHMKWDFKPETIHLAERTEDSNPEINIVQTGIPFFKFYEEYTYGS